jgi:hypothetical protein
MQDREIGYVRPDDVIAALESAGATLLALPHKGFNPGLSQIRLDIVQSALDAYGWSGAAIRLPAPGPEEIARMDEVLGWLSLIPARKYVLRRLLGARALVHPLTARYLYPWRQLAKMLHTDHKTVQRWHKDGIEILVADLQRTGKV